MAANGQGLSLKVTKPRLFINSRRPGDPTRSDTGRLRPLLAEIHRAARAICAEAGYSGAGTVEFLVGEDGTISFLEVNTRLQVEHPVSEETTGLDLVREQFRIAAGQRLRISEDPEPVGHAIEFRINGEDAGRGFLPAPGTVTRFVVPSGPGVRVDAGVEAGSVIGGQFDSLLAKVIVTGTDRQQALQRSRRVLDEMDPVFSSASAEEDMNPRRATAMRRLRFMEGRMIGQRSRRFRGRT